MMGTKRFGIMAIWAGGTFALAMALGVPATSNAVDDANSPALVQTILTPELTVHGVELTITPEAATTRPSPTIVTTEDGRLKFDVRAENKTNGFSSGSFSVRLTSVSPVSAVARTLPKPTEIWKDSGSFNLAAGEIRTFTFTAPPLSANRIFTLNIGSLQNQVAMVSMLERSR
jgi:hypothetical protein